jgi:hypothetical protein
MANIPEYSRIVVFWEDIKEDIPALLSNPYTWLEEQLKIASLRSSRLSADSHFVILLEIMHMLNDIHFHVHDE